jgi:hypothetical protein
MKQRLLKKVVQLAVRERKVEVSGTFKREEMDRVSGRTKSKMGRMTGGYRHGTREWPLGRAKQQRQCGRSGQQRRRLERQTGRDSQRNGGISSRKASGQPQDSVSRPQKERRRVLA